MKTKTKSLLALFVVFTVAFSNLPILAAVNYVTAVRNVSSNEVYIGDSEEVEVELSITGTPPVNVVKPNDVVLVLDKSGSMASDNRFTAMKESAQEFIDLIDFSTHQVGVVDYSSSTSSYNLSSDATAIKSYIKNIAMGGGTATHLAIDAALNILTTNGREDAQPVILLLTDGAADNSFLAKSAAQAAKDAGVVFYTIALLGPNDNPDTSSPNLLLQEMATTSHHHHFVLGSVGLMDIYRAIVKEIGIASAYDVEITETVPEQFEIVKGSYEHNIPRPTADGNTLTWNMLELKTNTLDLSYQIKAKDDIAPGTYKIKNTITYKDYAGAKRRYALADTVITVKLKSPVINKITEDNGDFAGGQKVTITGENFYDGATVKFGSTLATDVVVENEQTITATVPKGSVGTVKVTVTNPDKQEATVDYKYTSTPVVDAITPNTLEVESTVEAFVTGSNFEKGMTITIGGVTAPITYYYGTGKVRINIPANSVAGMADLVATNPSGPQTTLKDAVEYTALPAPVATSISPDSVEAGKTVTAYIDGSDFRKGATVTFGGVSSTSVYLVNSTQLRVAVPANSVPGTVDVVVTNPDGQSTTIVDGFTYTEPPKAAGPEITSISPAEVETGKTVVSYIEGANFKKGITATIGGVDAAVTYFYGQNKIRITVPASDVSGVVDVVVTNPDGQEATLVGGFEYLKAAAPTITSISVQETEVETTVDTIIEGTNFHKNVTVTIGGIDAPVSYYYGTEKIKVTVPASSVAGSVDVVVTNPDGQSATEANGFTYTEAPQAAAPQVTSVEANSVEVGNTLTAYVYGSDFQKGATVTIGGVDAPVTYFHSATKMRITVPASDVAGTVDVVVTNPDGQQATLKDGFTYTEAPKAEAPEVTSIKANSVEIGNKLTAYVYGANFQKGATVTIGGVDTPVDYFYSSSKLRVIVPASDVAGVVDVVVTNPDGQEGTLVDGFTYTEPALAAAPVVTSVEANSVAVGSTAVAYVYGENFQKGATVTIGNVDAPVTYFYSATKMRITVPAGTAVGAVDVVVTNPDGQEGTLTNGFEYIRANGPVVTSISVQTAEIGNKTTVIIQGENFEKGVTVTVGGVDAPVDYYYTSKKLRVIVPASDVAGTVDVVVTNPDGQETVVVGGFTYTEPPLAPAPEITNITVESLAIGKTATAYINGANFQKGVTVTIGGVDAKVSYYYSAKKLRITVPAGTTPGVVDVVITNPDGQQATLVNGFEYL